MDRRTIHRHVTAVARRAGVHVHPHALRHTLATQCINRGMSLEAIAALLGHRSPRMTLVYARISDTTVAEQYFTATGAVEAETATSATTDRHTEPAASAAPTAARQRSLHPTARAGLPLPDHLRRLRLLRDRPRVRHHPAPPTRQRRRPHRPRPHPPLRRTDPRHRRQPTITARNRAPRSPESHEPRPRGTRVRAIESPPQHSTHRQTSRHRPLDMLR